MLTDKAVQPLTMTDTPTRRSVSSQGSRADSGAREGERESKRDGWMERGKRFFFWTVSRCLISRYTLEAGWVTVFVCLCMCVCVFVCAWCLWVNSHTGCMFSLYFVHVKLIWGSISMHLCGCASVDNVWSVYSSVKYTVYTGTWNTSPLACIPPLPEKTWTDAL